MGCFIRCFSVKSCSPMTWRLLLVFKGLISFCCCFYECANILQHQTINWFEMARNNNIRYSPGACIYLGLLYSLMQITVALIKAVLECKEKNYIEGDYV